MEAAPDFLAHLAPAAAGDERALTALIEEFSPMVYQVALRTTGSAADAEDIVQEVFIGLPEALEAYATGSFPAWLKSIARHRAISHVRSDRRRRDRARSFVREDRLESRTLSRILVEEALARVEPMLREVFVLREVDGLSHDEIAERLGITAGASHIRMHRARVALRRIVGGADV